MNDLVLVENQVKDRFDSYAELLVKRDQLLKKASSYQIAYTLEFGELIKDNFEIRVECIKKKKSIAWCMKMINRGEGIYPSLMEAEIEKEMKLYYAELAEMVEENRRAKDSHTVSEFTLQRAKKLYRRLAKKLHPDINRKTMEREDLHDLWTRAVLAYHCSDVDTLEELEMLTYSVMGELGDEGFEVNETDLDKRIEHVERQINEILDTEPYTYTGVIVKRTRLQI
ncbi:MAG: hypothetical protein K5696_05120 [Lachnospiraceae bacterium]|nr:hypothetical protein [Lachnospiraceae bacterium]